MNIEPSLIIWTILCFAAMYCILKFLLFDPILKLMDERNARIAAAEQKLSEVSSGSAGTESADSSSWNTDGQIQPKPTVDGVWKESAEQRLKKEQELDETIRSEGKKRVEEAKRKSFSYVTAFQQKMNEKVEQDLILSEESAKEAANLFISHLF